jgi:hypothetical protein
MVLSERRTLAAGTAFPTYCFLLLCALQTSEGGGSAGAGSGAGGPDIVSAGPPPVGYVTAERGLFRSSSTLHREEALRTLRATGGLVPADASDGPSNDYVSPLLTDMYQVSGCVAMGSWLWQPPPPPSPTNDTHAPGRSLAQPLTFKRFCCRMASHRGAVRAAGAGAGAPRS